MAAVLRPRKEFEDILGGRGTALKVPVREYTLLADDMRLNPEYNYSLEETRDLELRAIRRRHFWDSVRQAASAQGVPLHEAAIARGAHLRPAKEAVVGDHNELHARAQAAREADGHRRDEQILANIESSRANMEDALNRPRSMTESIAETARTVVGKAGGLAAGIMTGTGVGHDVAQYFAGNTAADAVYAVDAVGQTVSDTATKLAHKAQRHRVDQQGMGTYRVGL